MADYSDFDVNNPYLKIIRWGKDPKNKNRVSYVSKSRDHFNVFVPDRSCGQPKPNEYWKIIPPVRLIKKWFNGGIYAVRGEKVEEPKPLLGDLIFFHFKKKQHRYPYNFISIHLKSKPDLSDPEKFEVISQEEGLNVITTYKTKQKILVYTQNRYTKEEKVFEYEGVELEITSYRYHHSKNKLFLRGKITHHQFTIDVKMPLNENNELNI